MQAGVLARDKQCRSSTMWASFHHRYSVRQQWYVTVHFLCLPHKVPVVRIQRKLKSLLNLDCVLLLVWDVTTTTGLQRNERARRCALLSAANYSGSLTGPTHKHDFVETI